jgi:hypothetical protein
MVSAYLATVREWMATTRTADGRLHRGTPGISVMPPSVLAAADSGAPDGVEAISLIVAIQIIMGG